MSWDIVLFKSKQKIMDLENLNDEQLSTTNFDEILKSSFTNIQKIENHIEISGSDFSIDFFEDTKNTSNKTISLYGENALFEIIKIAKKENWQIYDSSLDAMLDLDNPSKNGYSQFQTYVNRISKEKNINDL